MDSANLLENTVLCYLPLAKIQEWIKKNNLWKKDFTEIRKKWQKINSSEIIQPDSKENQAETEINQFSLKNLLLEKNSISFFIDTELLIIEQDIILLQVFDENVQEYLTKNYSIQEQKICQELFGENKHLILLTQKQWNFLNNEFNTKDKKIDSAENLLSFNSSNCFVLFKNEEIIKNKLTQWLEIYK